MIITLGCWETKKVSTIKQERDGYVNICSFSSDQNNDIQDTSANDDSDVF